MAEPDLPVGRPSDSIRIIELGDELSVFDKATGVATALNRTAADIVALADGTATVTSIVHTLARAYEMTPAEIESQIRAVIDQLTEANILVPAR